MQHNTKLQNTDALSFVYIRYAGVLWYLQQSKLIGAGCIFGVALLILQYSAAGRVCPVSNLL